jgi:hypothetical protein
LRVTQSTLRFLIGGLITTCLLANLTRGDDKNSSGRQEAAVASGGGQNTPSKDASNSAEATRKTKVADLMKQYLQSAKYQAEIAAIKKRELACDFVIRTGNRSSFRAKNEHEINRRLDGPVTAFDYHETPLQQIIDDLACWSEIDIVPDVAALKAGKISFDQPVSMRLEGATLKRALNLLLQKANLNYEVVNDAIVIIPAGLVRPGVDCFTNPEGKANPGDSLTPNSNGLKLLGVDLSPTTSGDPHLPPSVPTFVPVQKVSCPIRIPISGQFLGCGRSGNQFTVVALGINSGIGFIFGPPEQDEEPRPSPPDEKPCSPGLLAAFLPPEPVYLDQAVPENFTFGFGVVFPR